MNGYMQGNYQHKFEAKQAVAERAHAFIRQQKIIADKAAVRAARETPRGWIERRQRENAQETRRELMEFPV